MKEVEPVNLRRIRELASRRQDDSCVTLFQGSTDWIAQPSIPPGYEPGAYLTGYLSVLYAFENNYASQMALSNSRYFKTETFKLDAFDTDARFYGAVHAMRHVELMQDNVVLAVPSSSVLPALYQIIRSLAESCLFLSAEN